MHLSDSSNLNPNISYERKLDFYSAFRLNFPDSDVAGLNKRPNESYFQSDFENIQRKCAQRGVTIIPEIEAPGHALPITQWFVVFLNIRPRKLSFGACLKFLALFDCIITMLTI